MTNIITPPTVLATPGGSTPDKEAQLMKSVPETPKRALLYARVSTEAQAADDKTSLDEQLFYLRKYAKDHGYIVVEEISEDVTGRKYETEGLERARELAATHAIDAWLIFKWKRFARSVARYEMLTIEMKAAGVELISLDGQSNKTSSGRMFNRMMAAFSEYERDELVETMQQGKRGRARTGKIVPGRFAPYGFEYDRSTRSYSVDESRMRHVRRLFSMVGVEGAALWAVKRDFDSEGVPTTCGGRYWSVSTLRGMIFNDAYLPHTHDELEILVGDSNLTPDVLAPLDPDSMYGIQWYNRNKVETIYDPAGGERQIKTPRPKDEWIAVPVPDAGIPREHIEAARNRIKDNVRPSDAGRRYWNLKGLAYCPCGARLRPHTVPRNGSIHFYYICRAHRSGQAPCPYAKYHPADNLEGRVGEFVLGLIRDPETLREQVEAEAAREKDALRDRRKHIAALANRLAEAESERDRYNRLYARGKLSDDEYDAYTAELVERKKAAEGELEQLEDAKRYAEYLDDLPRLIEDYLRELPQMIDYMPRIRESTISEEHKAQLERDRRNGHGMKPYPVVPGMHRKRTPEEMDQLRREAERERAKRYRTGYEMLNLKVVAYPDGALDISWSGGRCKLSGIPR